MHVFSRSWLSVFRPFWDVFSKSPITLPLACSSDGMVENTQERQLNDKRLRCPQNAACLPATFHSHLTRRLLYIQLVLLLFLGAWFMSGVLHAATGGFPCPICGKIYKHRGNMRRHVAYECGKQARFECSGCPRRFHQLSNLKRHFYTQHKVKKFRVHKIFF